MSAEGTIGRFFRAVDERDWATVRELLAPELDLDYTSLFGGEPERLGRDDIVARWAAMLPGFDATQHLIGPLVESAEHHHGCNVRAYHHLDGDTWLVAGWYDLTTTTERDGPVVVAGITLSVSYETGPRSLVDRARDRAGDPHPAAAPTAAHRGERGTPAGSG